jgi:signal transduction histidine kinase
VTIAGVPSGTVVAARSIAPEEALLHRVRLLLVAGGGIAFAASLGAGWMLAGRAVRPVRAAYDAQAGFAADASHELRTPLTFIRSGVEVLAEREPDLGREVLSEIDYLTGLTKRLLLLARAQGEHPERGRESLDVERIDVAELCRSVTRRGEGALGLELDRAGDVPEGASALGDRVAAEAALDAVLENVAAHGGGRATLRWEKRDGDIVISVEDRGPGIPRGLEERAFERFARGDPSRTRETGGAGLGLSLAKALIETQGGRMWLEPTPGGGLTVSLALRSA